MRSGNFDSELDEIMLVDCWLSQCMGYGEHEYSVSKYQGNRSDCDIVVSFTDPEDLVTPIGELTVEVKEESPWRWDKYRQLGLDYISAFQYLPKAGDPGQEGTAAYELQHGVHCERAWVDYLLENIQVDKPGKLFYSNADIWLFVCHGSGGDEFFAYWGDEVANAGYRTFVENSLPFTVNNKPEDQGSFSDDWGSVVFFANLSDMPEAIPEGTRLI